MRATRAKYLRRECKARFPSATPVQLYGRGSFAPPVQLPLTHTPGPSCRRLVNVRMSRDRSLKPVIVSASPSTPLNCGAR